MTAIIAPRISLTLALLFLASCGKPTDRESLGPPEPEPLGKAPHRPVIGVNSLGKAAPATPLLPTPVAEPRDFLELTAEDQAEFARIENELWQATDPGERAQLLTELQPYYGEALIGVAEKLLLTSDDPDLRVFTVRLVAGNTSPLMLGFLGIAADDEAPAVRAEACYAAAGIRDPGLVTFLEHGLRDQSPEVRSAAIETAEFVPARSRLEIYRGALDAPHTDIVLAAIDGLEIDASPSALEILFTALDSPNEEARTAARSSVEWLTDEQFSTAAEAHAWWTGNKKSYGQDLGPPSENPALGR